VCKIREYNKSELLRKSVTCSRTRNHPPEFTHCGSCGQCIDRIFAVYASEADEYEDGNYYAYFVNDDVIEEYLKKAVVDYIRLADEFSNGNLDFFYTQRASEIIEIIEYVEGDTEKERLEKMFSVCQKHSVQIKHAIHRMRERYDNPYEAVKPFFGEILGTRAYKQVGEEIRWYR
jgi:hypothetical protein